MSFKQMPAWLVLSAMFFCGPALHAQVPNKAEIEKTIREYLLEHPEILLEMSQTLQKRQAASKRDQAQSALAAHRSELVADTKEGEGIVTVVEFFDFRCGYCKKVNPAMEKMMVNNPDVRVVYKQYPILGEDSIRAAQAVLAAAKQGGYLKLHHALLEAHDLSQAAVEKIAADQGLDGKHVITLARASVEGFLTLSARRDLREHAFKAWIARGANGGESDNGPVLAEAVGLRTEYARLMGFKSYADFSLEDTMAKSPAEVSGLLQAVWPKAVARAKQECAALAEEAQREGGNFKIAPWDWRYYAEKVRKAKFDLDEAELRPYFQLDQMIDAAFACASKLFGLKFKELSEAPRYHPDVKVWEVKNRLGEHAGIFLGDYFARPSKRSGAWMTSFREQHKLGSGQRPIIVNVMNFAKGAEGQPALLSFDDARTLFHEFGHGLHGLLSDVNFPSIAGTAVSTDFVELPSQLYEHWLSAPEVLERFARHYKTGNAMPADLLARVKAARNFNQGFATVEYTSSALVDMALYAQDGSSPLNIETFERDTLEQIGMPQEIVMRHRLPHFMHIMGGYAAGYYSYLWSEVMDADAFEAFEETGNVFDKKTAGRLKEFIYSAGNRRDPHDAYVAFRGRPPKIEGLLKKRGFAA